MKEKEFKLILDREKHEADVRQHFSKHIDLLVDLADNPLSETSVNVYIPQLEDRGVIVRW